MHHVTFVSPDASGSGQQIPGDWPTRLGSGSQGNIREDPSCKCSQSHQSPPLLLLHSPPRSCRIRSTSIFSPPGNSPFPLFTFWELVTEEAEWWAQQCGGHIHVIPLIVLSANANRSGSGKCLRTCICMHVQYTHMSMHACLLLKNAVDYKYKIR